jgi:hypothetical protein
MLPRMDCMWSAVIAVWVAKNLQVISLSTTGVPDTSWGILVSTWVMAKEGGLPYVRL